MHQMKDSCRRPQSVFDVKLHLQCEDDRKRGISAIFSSKIYFVVETKSILGKQGD